MREPTIPASMPVEPSQQIVIPTVFEAGGSAATILAQTVPMLDRDRVEYAVASLLVEEAWVSARE